MVEFGVLGPIQVSAEGRTLPGGSVRERSVLAMLLLAEGRSVTTDRLIDMVWQEPPMSSRAQLHNMISRWRRRLGDGLIVTQPAGYQLRLGAHGLDLSRFRELVSGARSAAACGEPARAVDDLSLALGLWRGTALADVLDAVASGVRELLHEERLAAAEARLDAELALGLFDEVLRQVPGLIADSPYRERLYEAELMALAGAGRRADALAAYRRASQLFVDDLGVEPGPRLRELERRVLAGRSWRRPVGWSRASSRP